MILRTFRRRLRTIYTTRRKRFLNALPFLPAKDQTHFIILCQPRTGSTLLHTYLNSHPHIFSYGEVLRRNSGRTQATDLYRYVFRKHNQSIDAVGLKIFYSYRIESVYSVFFKNLVRDTNIRVIHLTRENSLEAFISLKYAEKLQKWSSVSKAEDNKIFLRPDPEEFIDYHRNTLAERENMKRLFEKHQILDVTYESLIKRPDETLKRVQQFLHVEEKRLFTLLRKQGNLVKRRPENMEALSVIYSEIS